MEIAGRSVRVFARDVGRCHRQPGSAARAAIAASLLTIAACRPIVGPDFTLPPEADDAAVVRPPHAGDGAVVTPPHASIDAAAPMDAARAPMRTCEPEPDDLTIDRNVQRARLIDGGRGLCQPGLPCPSKPWRHPAALRARKTLSTPFWTLLDYDSISADDRTGLFIGRWDGRDWTVFPVVQGHRLEVIQAQGPSEAWAAGHGHIVHWDGRDWTVFDSGHGGAMNGLWMNSASDGWAFVSEDAFHWDGQRWTKSEPFPARGSHGAVWSSGPDDVWALAHGSSAHWNGKSWTALPMLGDAIWGTGPKDVWALTYERDPDRYGFPGPYQLRHWDGAVWTAHTNPELFGESTSMWASAPDQLFVLSKSVVWRWDGKELKKLPPPADPVIRTAYALVGRGRDDLWVGGGLSYHTPDEDPETKTGWLARWNGQSWSSVMVRKPIWQLQVDSSGGVWAFDSYGPAWYWDRCNLVPAFVE
jgi:hypothetical protein